MKKQNIQNNKSCRRVHKGVKQISFMENRGENVRVQQKYDSDRSRIPFTPPPPRSSMPMILFSINNESSAVQPSPITWKIPSIFAGS